MTLIASHRVRWMITIILAVGCGGGVTGLGPGDSTSHWGNSYGIGAVVTRRGYLELWFMKEVPWEEPAAAASFPGTTYCLLTERHSLNIWVAQMSYGDVVSNVRAHRRAQITVPAWFIVLVTLALMWFISGKDLARQVQKTQRGFTVLVGPAENVAEKESAPRARPAAVG